jgi:hypothetical protein
VPSDAGGKSCVPPTGACTANADCCNGSFCQVPAGSVAGSCTPVPVPPPPPPPDAGITYYPDGAVTAPDGALFTDSAAVPDTSTPPIDSSPPPVCSLYGQGCNTATDCCNGIPCTQTDGVSVCTGQAGCTCVFPLR